MTWVSGARFDGDAARSAMSRTSLVGLAERFPAFEEQPRHRRF
jgi:hypothetical protein